MKVFRGKIWTALGSLMDHAGAAASTKASTAAAPDRALLTDIEAAIARCTDGGGGGGSVSDDRHVHEILFLVSNAPGAITFLSRRITARLEAARTPATALRSLLLVHRLLRAGDRYFEQDFRGLWASRDLRVNAPRCGCSCSPLAASGAGVNYVTASVAAATGACSFLHGYTAYIEERMQWVINQSGNLEPTPPPQQDPDDGKPHPHSSYDHAAAEALLFKLAMCQRLLDVAVQLLPDNNTSASAAARSAFGIVLRESFKVYDAFKEGLDLMLRSRSVGLTKSLRVSAHEVLRKACAQTPELKDFYHKCKKSNVGKVMEYPVVRVVTQATELVPPVSREEELDSGEVVQESEGDMSFESKLETTINAVWVEFDDDDQQAGRETTGDDHGSLQAQQPS
ncbi:putative clathrin assembly protein At1g33340 [Lolium rigidum]|uniref:putative clathrin assembly protein At1g33340 n=1 Tax=Lolium rigidum TaxID=89674 RepID=UPI001F5C7283|nr:putative clathrin assembly protein At1g33340 [Lolium rigidum]